MGSHHKEQLPVLHHTFIPNCAATWTKSLSSTTGVFFPLVPSQTDASVNEHLWACCYQHPVN